MFKRKLSTRKLRKKGFIPFSYLIFAGVYTTRFYLSGILPDAILIPAFYTLFKVTFIQKIKT